ncbi:replication-relaxation family protein [Streptomyces sp. NPDC059378]|uniref:replication-relaxation family protein n=1 Tax=Streptomyces sp. NPDC059378 TaxID=3346815 RepID=UPI0036AA3C59
MWSPTGYGVRVAADCPEFRGRRAPKSVSDPTAVRLRVGHGLTVTETGLAFPQDARRRGDVCRPLDWIPEVHHALGGGEAVVPDALLFYRRTRNGGDGGEGGVMLGAFVEVDRRPWVRSIWPRRSARTAGRPGAGPGRMVATLPALPTAAVRPGRHRPRQHHPSHHRPARSRPGHGRARLPARRSRPGGPVGRPAAQRALSRGVAACPRPRSAGQLDALTHVVNTPGAVR